MGTTAVGRELARYLPSHLQRHQGRGVGKALLQICGNRRCGQLSLAEHQSQSEDLVEGKKVRDTKANGEEDYGLGSGRQIESRVGVWPAMWEKHLQSPVSALDEAQRRVAPGRSTAGGSTV